MTGLIFLHRFFIAPENISGSIVHFNTEESRHIDKVLRFKVGDDVQVFDGLGHEYEVRLINKENGLLSGEIVREVECNPEAPIFLSLVQGMAKSDKMDTIIQKAVEVGVGDIYPLASQHAVVKLDGERAAKKVERWQNIAREACKQCRRSRVPAVHAPASFSEILQLVQGVPAILLYENEKHCGLKTVLQENRVRLLSAAQLFLIIGPEGGFAPAEVAAAQAAGVMTAGLGPRILRTETAGLVAASIILYELGDLG